MKLKYVYIFIPILILLAAYYFYDKSRQDETTIPTTIGSVINLDKAAVSVIEMNSAGGTIRVVRDGTDRWRIESPAKTPADGEAVTGLLDAIAKAGIERVLGPVDAASLGEYELDNPSYSVEFIGDSGKILAGIKLGAESASTKGRYASVDDNMLYLLSSGATAFTDVGYDKLRSCVPLQFDRSSITAFEVSTGDVDYAFTLDSGSWNLVRPEKFKASEEWCDGYLQLLERVKAEEFIPGPVPADIQPLSGGVKLTDKDGKVYLLKFLGVHLNKGVYASSPSLPEPFYTEFRIADYPNVSIGELKESRLIMFTKAQIARVVFREVGGDNLEFELKGDGYKITKPADRRIYKQTDFDAFFDVLLNLEAARYVTEYENFEKLGLDPYWIKIELYKPDNTGSVNLYIGGEVEDGYYANIDKREQVFVISKVDMNEILKTAEVLRTGVR